MPKIKTDFVISGEKQYKQAISDINRGLGVLDSEMKKVSAQYRDNENSVEALAAKNDVLERKMLSQKEKIEQLRQALQASAEQYGEADKRTMAWQKSLNEAEAALADTEHQIKKNNETMEDTSDTTEELSLNVKDLASQFGIKLPGGLDKALSSFKNFSTGAVGAVGAVAAVVSALVTAETKLINLTKDAAENADEIITLSQVTGIDTRTIQELRYSAQLIDVSFETIRGSLTKLKRSQDSARDGNKEIIASFEALGVAYQNADGTLRNSEDVFYDVIDALGKIESSTDRDVIAMQLFGRSAEDLNPLIIQGSNKLREYASEAENINYILSEESLDALASVDDAYQRLQKTQEAVRNQIAVEMAPAVEEFYNAWSDFIQTTAKEFAESGIIEGLGDILESLGTLIPVLEGLISTILPGLGEGLKSVSSVLDGISWAAAGLADLWDFIDGIVDPLNWGSGKASNALGFGYNSGNPSHLQQWEMRTTGSYNAYQERYSGKSSGDWYYDASRGTYATTYGGQTPSNAIKIGDKWYDKTTGWEIPGYATGTLNFAGGRAIVGENGPELVDLPVGSRIWNAQDTRSGVGGVVINGNVILDAGSVEDLVDAARFLQDLRVVRRMG